MNSVKGWEETVMIPTYEVGAPDKNPMFLEKRVYQGSSGKVYPYPTTEKISSTKKDMPWKAVFLENEYIRIMILPELGGRIQRAYDKTNDYDFVYYNHVIKPALVGLAGPWISGGIEFNWPQHHRPTTYMPVDHKLRENADGSITLQINDVDRMYGTKGIAEFTLYPGRAYIEIRGQLYNRTPLPQTFLWWANPAVSVNDYTQSIFPPDVHNVMDHGKRDVSRFPIAKGVYYKHDYSEGVDISRYKNIPVPTSYMAEHSEYDFVGGYDYSREAGLLHVSDHHFSPGKKQWTWGCGDFGKAWDRNLTDDDGPYIELMTGVYTENQPDFTWLKPFEEKTFLQYFMPYKKVGAVKNATVNAALNMEIANGRIDLTVYATGRYESALIALKNKNEIIFRDTALLSPTDIYEKSVDYNAEDPCDITAEVYSMGRLLVAYTPKKQGIPKAAQPAEAAKEPQDIMTNEELLLTAQHIEQHRHATYLPDPYYLEGLKRDPGDIRINNAYGMLLLRRGLFARAEEYFRAAIKRMTWRSPNPYTSEPYYNLGLALLYQGRRDEAYDAFAKAAWSSEQQEMSYYYMAVLDASRGELERALYFVDKGLVKNWHNVKARGLKAVILRRIGRADGAKALIAQNLELDAFDYVSLFELELLGDETAAEKRKELMRGNSHSYLLAARDYGEAGFFDEAIAVLKSSKSDYPMVHYYLGYYLEKKGRHEEALAAYDRADACSPLYCFPNNLEDIAVLESAIAARDKAPKAYYYLGNLCYDKLQYERAIELWEKSVSLDDSFPTALRNLGIAYYNKKNDLDRAVAAYERAYELDESDTRVFLELDQLYKKKSVPFAKRLARYEEREEVIRQRDDAMLEYVTLCNLTGQYQRAYDIIMSHHFRPWEGAEGRITGQYKLALTQLAIKALSEKDAKKAKELLEKSLSYPINLGEGRLEGTKDNNIYYYLGLAEEMLGNSARVKECMERAKLGENEPAGCMYYYDQPADMILYKGLAFKHDGETKAACACFNKLMDYGERHLYDEMKPDFFAVSLPDFLIFDDDADARNKAHCYYLMGLANLGLEEYTKARENFDKALSFDYNHQNARIYAQLAAIS